MPEYRKIFRQPGCLREILKVFRPTLADGLVLSSISWHVFRAEKGALLCVYYYDENRKVSALPRGRALDYRLGSATSAPYRGKSSSRCAWMDSSPGYWRCLPRRCCALPYSQWSRCSPCRGRCRTTALASSRGTSDG